MAPRIPEPSPAPDWRSEPIELSDADSQSLSEEFAPSSNSATVRLGMEEAVAEALENNAGLRAEYMRFLTLAHKAPQARSLPDPRLTFTCFIESVQTRTGEQNFIAGLSQTFPWFGKRSLRGRIAEQEALAAFDQARAHALDIARDVKATYANLLFEHQALDLAEEEKTYWEQFIDTAAAYYAAGESGRQGLLRGQAELARIDTELLGYPGRIEALEARLARLMSREQSSDPIGFPEASPLLRFKPDVEDFNKRAFDGLPGISSIDRMIEKARLAQRLARKDYYPDVTLGINYIQLGDRPDDPGARPSDESEDPWNVTIAMNLPLPNARRAAQIAEADRMEREQRLRRKSAEDRAVAEVESAAAMLRSTGDRIDAFQSSVLPLAMEAHETSQAEYIAGGGTYLDLIDAERAFLAARRQYLRLIRDYRIALAELERAVGAPLTAQDEEANAHEQ